MERPAGALQRRARRRLLPLHPPRRHQRAAPVRQPGPAQAHRRIRRQLRPLRHLALHHRRHRHWHFHHRLHPVHLDPLHRSHHAVHPPSHALTPRSAFRLPFSARALAFRGQGRGRGVRPDVRPSRLLPSACSLLLPASCFQPPAFCLLPTADCLLPSAYFHQRPFYTKFTTTLHPVAFLGAGSLGVGEVLVTLL